MKRWTNKAIKQHIEELIEESYFLALPDDEVRAYFKDFLDVCEQVLRTNISIHGDLRIFKIKIALLRAQLFVSENIMPGQRSVNGQERIKTSHEFFVEQVLIARRSITKLFELLDPQAVQIIFDETEKIAVRRRKFAQRKEILVSIVLKAGYYLLLAGAIALVLYVVFH